MSFDISFHPFGPEEIERYVFDVWRAPALSKQRAAELTDDPLKQRAIVETLYARFPAWRDEALEGTLRTNETLALSCAALSGYRHFYFHARGSALSFLAEHLPELTSLFVPLSRLPGAPPELKSLDFNGALIDGNFRASGLLPLEHFDALRSAFDQLDSLRGRAPATFFSLFDAGDRRALEEALAAAERLGLGLIEAADLVVPARGEGSTDLDKLRLIHRHEQESGDVRELFPCLSKGGCGS